MEKILLKGNVAIAKAAVEAGCMCYFGYPITPQSEIGEYLSSVMLDLKRVFVPVESELCAINMLMGATSTGVRAMTSSSSCGIALMQEGISAMASAQLPGVIISVMRGGPGLGNIAPSQCDYNQAVTGGGNGDYKIVVLTPSSVQEAIDLTYLAFHLAFKYRIPSMLLADGVLGQMMEPCELRENPYKNEKYDVESWALDGAYNRKPKQVLSLYMGHGELEKHVWHLEEKFKKIEENETRYEEYMTDDAEIVITAFGVVARMAKEAVKVLRKQGFKVGLFRPITVRPFPKRQLFELASKPCVKAVLDVEMNAGQMLKDVESSVFGACEVQFLGKPGGSLLNSEDIVKNLKSQFLKQEATI